MSALDPISGSLGKKRAAHLLRRATFGPTKQQINDYASKNVDTVISELFAATTTPALPTTPSGTTWIGTTPTQTEKDSDYQEYFKRWFLDLMLKPTLNVTEKIVFFLHTHFTTRQSVVDNSRALYYQNALFRLYALDKADTTVSVNGVSKAVKRNFKELTKKICIDNAMLILLDGRLNVKNRIQENFARELIELYTVGKGRNLKPTQPDDYVVFKQSDIVAAANVLTGYDSETTNYSTLDTDTNLPRGIVKGVSGSNKIASQHDNSTKVFSNYFGSTSVVPNQTLLQNNQATEDSVLDELDQLINLLYDKSSETAMNICRKIYRFFVYFNITDSIDANVITPLANTFKSNGFKLQPVLEQLFKSQHFYDSNDSDVNNDNYGAIIKSPLDLVAGTLRSFGINPDTDFSNKDTTLGSLIDSINGQGLVFYEPYDVAGYDAYHQDPFFQRSWISTNRLTNRYNFISNFTQIGSNGSNGFGFKVDLVKYVENNVSNPSDPNVLVSELVADFLPAEITSERTKYFKFVLNADLPDTNWAVEWGKRSQASAPAIAQVQKLFNAMLQSPEYQLY